MRDVTGVVLRYLHLYIPNEKKNHAATYIELVHKMILLSYGTD